MEERKRKIYIQDLEEQLAQEERDRNKVSKGDLAKRREERAHMGVVIDSIKRLGTIKSSSRNINKLSTDSKSEEEEFLVQALKESEATVKDMDKIKKIIDKELEKSPKSVNFLIGFSGEAIPYDLCNSPSV